MTRGRLAELLLNIGHGYCTSLTSSLYTQHFRHHHICYLANKGHLGNLQKTIYSHNMYNKHFLETGLHLIDIIKLFTNLQNCFLPLQLQIHHYWSKDPMNTTHYYLRRTLSMNLTEVHNKLDHFFHSWNSFFDSSQIHRLSYYRICILL